VKKVVVESLKWVRDTIVKLWQKYIRPVLEWCGRQIARLWNGFWEFMAKLWFEGLWPAIKWVGRQIARLWNGFWEFMAKLWNEGIVPAIQWCGRQIARAWRNLMSFFRNCLTWFVDAAKAVGRFARNVVVDAFNFLQQPFVATYKDQTNFKGVFLHGCNLAIAGCGVWALFLLPKLLPLGWAIGVAVMIGVPLILTCYLGLGNFLLKSGNWLVGGAIAFGLSYAVGVSFNRHGDGDHSFWLVLLLSTAAGMATFLILFPAVYGFVRSVTTRLGLDKPLLVFFTGIYRSVSSLLSGMVELCVNLYIKIRDAAAALANSIGEIATQTAHAIAEWWARMTGGSR
jgi:hypothetical protein